MDANVKELVKALQDALNYIMVECEEHFVDDDGEQLPPYEGGNLSSFTSSFIYPDDEISFDFDEAKSVLEKFGGHVARYRDTGERYDLNKLFNRYIAGEVL